MYTCAHVFLLYIILYIQKIPRATDEVDKLDKKSYINIPDKKKHITKERYFNYYLKKLIYIY